jgi:rhodanese-related sulfurtransferase
VGTFREHPPIILALTSCPTKEVVMTGVKEMVAAAKAGIENLRPAEVAEELAWGDAVAVDIREPSETADGIIPGAVLAPRGMLEFHADPQTPYHLREFDRGRRVILYCAAGSRSALGVCALRELGYRDVAHLEGGFNAWQEEGRPIEPPREANDHSSGRS